MSDCLHMFKGYRVPPETFQAAWQAIIDTRRDVDVPALRAMVAPKMKAVSPWVRVERDEAARAAIESFLFEAVRAGLVKRRTGPRGYPFWSRVREKGSVACR